MSVVVLDTGPLGLVSNPKATPDNEACRQWLETLVAQGRRVLVPEIADYEVRRELLRSSKKAGIARLNRIQAALEYVPITTEAMLLAADLWAQMRQQEQPTADIHALDGDVILAAQALTLGLPASEIVIVTVNVGHRKVRMLPIASSRQASAQDWQRAHHIQEATVVCWQRVVAVSPMGDLTNRNGCAPYIHSSRHDYHHGRISYNV